jgi:NAD(P)-dependent dehydrogenase (short-subunit alcohol dehydrogenase family)
MSQVPIDTGFGPANTAAEVIAGIDLTGKIAVVTGGYNGLGLATTKALVSAGATVLVAVRTPEKAAANLAGLSVETAPLDLLDPASIDAFAASFLASGRPLHILINNAAVHSSPLTHDGRGYEVQFATNHLGHFQLTARLWPALVKANGARVVCVSSSAHAFLESAEDWNFETRPYEPMGAYARSKAANILFVRALDARGAKVGVRAFAVHPGAIPATNLDRFQPREVFLAMAKQFGIVNDAGEVLFNPARQIKTLEEGASTTVWAATSPLLTGKGGLYLENNTIAPRSAKIQSVDPLGVDARGFSGVKDYVLDLDAAEKLSSLSEKLTGATFPI